MTHEQPGLLLVDDEPLVLRALERQLRGILRTPRPGYRIEAYTRPAEALQRARETVFDVVISDYRMPEMNGVAFLRAFRAIQPVAARLILSGQADLGGLADAVNEAGIMRYLSKPWDEAELVFAIENALKERRLLLENQRLADELRASRSQLSLQEAELRRLERESPGITQVNWGPDGEVLLDPDGETERKRGQWE
ncbi:MAG: response regulator [Betaproteobacteria bacterium]|nr:response regulator [Betaproteobacteria bacterium]